MNESKKSVEDNDHFKHRKYYHIMFKKIHTGYINSKQWINKQIYIRNESIKKMEIR